MIPVTDERVKDGVPRVCIAHAYARTPAIGRRFATPISSCLIVAAREPDAGYEP